MMKMTKFLQYLESRGKFRKKKSAKYIQVYIYIYQRKDSFISFSLLLWEYSVYFWSYHWQPYYIYMQIFHHFLPYLVLLLD